MFSEELSRNSSRKRAEENKARRRQLKEQQVKKAAAAVPTTHDHVTSQRSDHDVLPPPAILPGTAANPSAPNAKSNGFSSLIPGVPPQVSTTSGETKSLSAVERAEHERQRRARDARQTKAAITLQSFVRSCVSNAHVRMDIATLLERRLADLATLGKILQAKSSSEPRSATGGGRGAYVPPIATTTSFAQQLLFLSRTNPMSRLSRPDRFVVRLPSSSWSPLLASVLELCILPSLETGQISTNSLVSWMDNVQGRLRLEGVLRLSVVTLFSPDTSSKCRDVLTRFMRCLIVASPTSDPSPPTELDMSDKFADLCSHCRSRLLMKDGTPCLGPPAPSISSALQVPSARQGAPLDLIANLRYYLMFVVAGTSCVPIPSNAKDLRDKCISEPAKAVAGTLWSVVLDATEASRDVTERHILRCRIVSKILTVPLLSWKFSATAVNAFVSPSETKAALLQVVESFVELHAEVLNSGSVQLLLEADDVTLTVCPATQIQCLLANLVQFAIVCPAVNGADATKMRVSSATVFYTFLCTILDALPLQTFSSRDSSVEWMTDGKGQHTPIVLSSVILDQCKLIILDSFVRRLYQCSIISAEMLDVDAVLGQKNERDMKHERNLHESGAASASSLAAKEARIDRSVGFWNSSKWARKISKGVSSMLSSDAGTQTPHVSSPPRMTSNVDPLVNTSSMSRLLAVGKKATADSSEQKLLSSGKCDSNLQLFTVFCRLYGIILCRWGGGGHDDIVSTTSKGSDSVRSIAATATAEACSMSLLNVLGFSTQLLKSSWAVIQSINSIRAEVDAITDEECSSFSIRSLSLRPLYERSSKSSDSTAAEGSGAIFLYMFVTTLAHVLIVTDDIEIHDMERPMPIHQIRRCVEVLKKLLYRATYLEERTVTATKSNYFGRALVSASSRTMRDLYDRSSRRPICVPKLWLVPDLFEKEIRQCKSCSDFLALLSHPVLRVCPFLVSFKRRLKLFERIVTTNRIEVQGVNDLNPFNPNPLKPGIPVRIMRGRLLEDGLATMNHLGSNMRRRIAVQYVNEAGMQETGIDAGGLFKEFWTDWSAIAFNPNYALFRVTEGAGNCLYPNPSSGAAHGSDHVVLFEFLGRILGKALYEGITINPRFAHFFLSFLRGDYNYLHMLPDLSTVDPQLYNNLMFLKNYEGDAADLSLTFTVTSEEFGGTKEIPLVPNGAKIDVTSSNKQRYIGLVAKHYVVDRVREQSEAFTRGLWEVIDRSWLRIFNEPELQVLISGASDGKIDVDDLRANTKYAGGYSSLDRNVARFWSVVSSLDSTQQQCLLRFVTSCERPPPLGFASMNPAFTIQRVGLTRDDGKLPASSTCFNTLKLPIYSSEKVMKERLLYAIQSGAGFELT